ncbi:hypothetical protein ACH5RR_025303 [Cinchona calisaya]|uniref:DUF7950 domain-containing protein n=1 Tax=Cinchona calisaya TaxID=153742 RepID=A0ABD2YZ96_9GENT
MDARGGCCIARYGGNIHDVSKVDRIMMRFRPIAPKPATHSSGSGGSGNSTPDNGSSAYAKTGRGKRKYVRRMGGKSESNNNGSISVKKRCNCKRKYIRGGKSSSTGEDDSHGKSTLSTGSVSGGDDVVTLPLLPETPTVIVNQEESPARGTFEKGPMWLNFGGSNESGSGGFWMDGKVEMMAGPRIVGTWVRVECIISETWYEYAGLGGCTDDQKFMYLERDTCPGFISDGLNRVRWVNRAYKEMAVGQGENEEEEEEEEVLVWLVMKDGVQLPPKSWSAFTCSVRVITCGKEKNSVILPCDVWRLEGGRGFAWRLDTKAALSLGR